MPYNNFQQHMEIDLSFTANTHQAKKEIQDLKTALQEVAKAPGTMSGDFGNKSIKEASEAALILQKNLNGAVNVKTGKLDLSRFNANLKTSGAEITTLLTRLQEGGDSGQAAFMQMTKSIASAEAPMKRLNGHLSTFLTTLGNSARWQIASAVVHSAVGNVQQAFYYAQDLNESLNNIRIVTGKSADEMADFAKQANKAAKELRTTTTEYTDAALIFFQQGLSGEAVTERANAVIKMSNVTKDSATEVSSYMTAIWNNFADGSETLEHYADVITALGASTAASSSEIAEGLEKFASIGNTIGLSYDYATSILSALVANTRQSADAIGTALRTIFARLQGLSLGETLDDGVTLNKYSKALKTVGIDILEATGELKKADTILDETAAKWETLSKAQQTALAETIAGTRQYAQFVAMMEGWSDVEVNLQTAADADGTLQDQAEIYAESWEAAKDRVKASMEELYDDLLDDKFFITLTNGLAALVDAIDGLAKAFGGLDGLVGIAASLFLQHYAKEIPSVLSNWKQNLMGLTGAANQEILNMKSNLDSILEESLKNDSLSASYKVQIEGIREVNRLTQELAKNSKDLSKAQQEAFQARIDNVKAMYQSIAATEEEIQKNRELISSIAESQSKKQASQMSDATRRYAELTDKDTELTTIYTNNKLRIKENENKIQSPKTSTDTAIILEEENELLEQENNKIDQQIEKIHQSQDAIEARFKTLSQNSVWSNQELHQAYQTAEEDLIANPNDIVAAQQMEEAWSENVQNLVAEYEKLGTVVQEYQIIRDAAKSRSEDWKKEAQQIGTNAEATKALKNEMVQFIESIQLLEDENGTKIFETRLNDIKAKIQECSGSATDLSDLFSGKNGALTLINRMTGNGNGFNGLGPKMSQQVDGIRESLKAMISDFDELEKRIQQNASRNTEKIFSQGNANRTAQSTIPDETSTWEKQVQFFTKSASSLMMLNMGFQGLANTVNAFTDVLKGEGDALSVVTAMMGNAFSITLALNAAKTMGTTLDELGILNTERQTAATVLKFAADRAETGSIWAKVAAKLADNTATLAALGLTAAIAAAIWGVTKAIQFVISLTPSGRLKKLKQEASELKAALEEATTAVKDLASAFNNYDSLVDTLNNLTVGTQEWRDALLEANDAAIELATKYPEISLSRSANGLVTVDNADEVTSIYNTKRLGAQIASVNANTKVSQRQNDQDIKKALTDAGLGSGILGRSVLDIINSRADEISHATDKEVREILGLANASKETIETFRKLAKTVDSTNKSLRTQNQVLTEQALENTGALIGSAYGEAFTEALSSRLQEITDSIDVTGLGFKLDDLYNDITGGDYKAKKIGTGFVDSQGNTVTKEAVQNTIRAARAQEELAKSAEKLSEAFEGTDLTIEEVNAVVTRDFSSLTRERLSKYDAYGLDDIIDEDTKKRIASALGYDDWHKYSNELTEGRTRAQEDWMSLGNNWLAETQKQFNSLDIIDSLSLEQSQKIGEAINNAVADKIDPAYIVKKLDLLTIAEDGSVQGLDEFIESVDTSSSTLAGITKKFSDLRDILSGLEDGGTISSEDWAKLSENYQSYFQLTMDGTYKLIGRAQELNELLNDTQYADMSRRKDALITQSARLAGIEDSDEYKQYSQVLKLGEGNITGQIEYAKSLITDPDILKTLEDYGNQVTWTKEELKDIANIVKDAGDGANSIIESNTKELLELDLQYATAARDLGELKEFYESGKISLEAFNTAAWQRDLTDDVSMLDSDELEEYAKYLRESGYAMEGFNKAMSEDESQIVAKGIMKMNSAIDTLAENFKDAGDGGDYWISILKKSSSASEEYQRAMTGTRKAVADLLDISSEYVSEDFIASHLDEINKAATGDAETIDKLKKELSEKVTTSIADDLGIDSSSITSEIEAIQTALDNLKPGESLEGAMLENLNKMIVDTKMTTDQIQALFDSLGYEPTITTTDVQQEGTVSGYRASVNGSALDLFNGKGFEVDIEPYPVSTKSSTPVTSFSTTGKAPQIKSLTKKASGSANNYSSLNKGGKKPGKSGGSKNIEKPQENELDAYHDINREISDLSKEMSRLDTIQSKLWGKELISALRESNVLLEKQLVNYEKLDAVISSELGRLQGRLTAYGVTFSSTTGEIQNYTETYMAALKAYNDAITAYNASAQSEADKNALENAKDAYSKFKSLISEYDETLDKQLDNQQTKLEAQYKIIENNFKAWETNISVTLDLNEAKREWTKFWQKVKKDIKSAYTDYAKSIADAATNFNILKSGVGTDLKAVQEIMAEIDKMSAGEKSSMFTNISDAQDDLLSYSNTLRQDAESLYDLYENAWDEYLEGIDQVVDKWDKVVDKFNTINDTIEHNIKLIELLYGDDDLARQLNASAYEVQAQNTLAQMNTLRQAISSLQKEYDELLAAGAKETDKDVQAIREAIESNTSAMQSAIESYLSTLANSFENAVNIAMTKFEKSIMGGNTIEWVKTQWDDAKEAAEGYYDEVERVYQLETMESKWEAAINSSSTLKTQQKLKALMDEQLEMLRSKTKLSEYDIELAEKQLAVAQAQMALEDAQNAKNSMKVVRDEAGNWSYQYVADEDDVANKQQAFLDANNEWYEFTKSSWQTLTEDIVTKIQEAQTRLTELMLEYNTADESRREEIKAQYDYLYEYYYGEEGLIATKVSETVAYQDNLNIASMNSLWGLYEVDQENFLLMTEREKELINNLRDEGVNSYSLLLEAVAGEGQIYDQMRDKCIEINGESLEAWNTTAAEVIRSWNGDADSVRGQLEQAYEAVIIAQQIYDTAVASGCEAAGYNFANVTSAIAMTTAQTDVATQAVADYINETNALSSARASVMNIATAWDNVATAIENAIRALEDYLTRNGEVISAAKSNYSVNRSAFDAALAAAGNAGGSGGTTGGNSSNPWASKTSNSMRLDFTGVNGQKGTLVSANGSGMSDYSLKWYNVGQGFYSVHDKNGNFIGNSYNGWTQGFATGGYTGDWNDGSGKLAMLHSKELVLNKEDTANMLDAVRVLRTITSVGSSIASGVSASVANLLGLTKVKVNEGLGSTNSSGDINEFNITAEFPNAENVEEIREAIMSLPTLASQYLSQKKL